MKKIWKLFLVAGMGIALQFCSSDESPANRIVINGESHTEANLYFDNFGTVCAAPECGETDTHSFFLFAVTDGEYDENNGFDYYSYLLYLQMLSPDLEKFQAGTYDIYSYYEGLDEGEDFTGQKFGIALLDASGINDYNVSVTGTIKASGTMPKLTFNYNLTVKLLEWNGSDYVTKETFTIKGKTSGTFEEAVFGG